MDEAIDEAAGEFLANLRALAAEPFAHRVCDLSGGMDSRLVLAGILHEGLDDAFVFHTSGRHPNPDANVAALIRRRFGLARAGRMTPPTAQAPAGPLDALRTSVGRSGGLTSTFIRVGRADVDRSNILAVGGGTGETWRQFWSSGLPDLPAWRLAARAVRRAVRPSSRRPGEASALHALAAGAHGRAALLRPDERRAVACAIGRFADEAVAAGVAPQDVGDLYYLTSRARYHFGVWWAAATRARFHPLYSPAALRAAHALPVHERRANRLGFEVMRRLAPDLVDVPFADKRWHPSVMADAPEPVTSRTPHLGLPDERSVHAFPPAPPRPRREPTPAERALAARGARARVVGLGRMLEEFHARGPDYAALEPVFDADAVRRFMERPHDAFTGRYDVDDAYRVIGAHVWMRGDELR